MPTNGRRVVLLVEDESDLLELVQFSLERHGYTVATATNGARALKLLDTLSPDVIVTDMMMPVMDGLTFLARYAEREGEKCPIIAVSAFEPYLREAERLGASATLFKPYDIECLRNVIQEACSGATPTIPPITAPPAPHSDEEERLRVIFDLGLDRGSVSTIMDEFVAKVAAHFQVPVCLLSVITEDRQHWAAACGLREPLRTERGGPRSDSFCTHAVAARAALIVQDALENPFFRDNPFVTHEKFRFYAGVPLIARHGEALGTLCLLDKAPKTFTSFDLELLSLFGMRVLAAIEEREWQEHPAIPEAAFRYLRTIDSELGIFSHGAFMDLAVVEASRSTERGRPLSCAVLAVAPRRMKATVERLNELEPRSFLGRLGMARLGWLVPDLLVEDCKELAVKVVGEHGFVEAVDLTRYPGAFRAILQSLETSLGDAGLA